MFISEYCRYVLSRAWYYYPDALPDEAIATEQRESNGHVARNLSFPLEDLYPDGQPAGQVGQEVYGAGAAFIFASRALHHVEGAPFRLYCDLLLRAVERIGDRALSVQLDGGGAADGEFAAGPAAGPQLARQQAHHRRRRPDRCRGGRCRSHRLSRTGEWPSDPDLGMSMTDLNGKRILLTGGTSGIGSATLTALAAAGARVVTCGRHQASLEEAMAAAPGDVSVVAADLADEKGVDAVFAAVDGTLGGIDMLVACAALGADPIVDMDDTNWRYVLDTNLAAFLGCAKHSIERMEVAGGGHLLFVGSISTEIKAVGESVYAATKAGVQAFAETLRKEVAGRNIKVSVIQPGSVDTFMQQCCTEEKRAAVAAGEMLDPAEIAEAILFVLTRSAACDIVNLRIEPLPQKTA